MERIIEYTADGSATLFVPELDEHYHSVKGALTESSHIFIDMGLKTSAAPSPRILEIGFGTGLNALLTLIEAEKSGRQVHYTGIELYPLPWETVERLGYTNGERRRRTDYAMDEGSPYIALGRRRADHSTFHPEEDTGRLHKHGVSVADR